MAEAADDSLLLTVLKDIRKEQKDQRDLLLKGIDYTRRLNQRMDMFDQRFETLGRRLGEMRDDIELMVKSELMGRLGHFETQMEQALGNVSDRIDQMEGRGKGPNG